MRTFEENEDTIIFTIDRFSAYAGGRAPGEVEFNPEMRDAGGELVEYDLEFENLDSKEVKKEKVEKPKGFGETSLPKMKVKEGRYNIKVRPKDHPIKSIVFRGVYIDSNVNTFIRIVI